MPNGGTHEEIARAEGRPAAGLLEDFNKLYAGTPVPAGAEARCIAAALLVLAQAVSGLVRR